MIRPIVLWPDPVLTTPAAPEERFGSPELHSLVQDMFETMYAAPGVGLAAPQIGVGLKVAVIDSGDHEGGRVLTLVNPVIEERGPVQSHEHEGCLSIPEERHDVPRNASVVVRYRTPEGEEKTLSVDGFTAIVIQHEVDHLEGRLYPDHLSPLVRGLIRKRMKKRKAARPPGG